MSNPPMLTSSNSSSRRRRRTTTSAVVTAVVAILCCSCCSTTTNAFSAPTGNVHSQRRVSTGTSDSRILLQQTTLSAHASISCLPNKVSTNCDNNNDNLWQQCCKSLTIAATACTILLHSAAPCLAENELSAKYGNSGFDTSLVDQTCLVNHCQASAKACLQDDASCRKGLTCTAKCLGDNACITGCMARYGNQNLDNLLKCTIEDHECIKVAILPGGSDVYGQEPRAPAPTVQNFDYKSLQGSWYKVVGYNPNYDCYACQRNTFKAYKDNTSNNNNGFTGAGTATTVAADNFMRAINGGHKQQQQRNAKLSVDVEFSMPHLWPDGVTPPPQLSNVREWIYDKDELVVVGGKSVASGLAATTAISNTNIGLNDYKTNEVMVFDTPATTSNNNNNNMLQKLVLNAGQPNEQSYSRTAHSEGEMFGLKFWENWYIIGENDPGEQDFKFVYYNGKTRQNTYEGAFVYSRTKELNDVSMRKVYSIAQQGGMNPKQFCKIRNGCFLDDTPPPLPSSNNNDVNNKKYNLDETWRGILASTRISQLLGVEPVAARDAVLRRNTPTASVLTPNIDSSNNNNNKRAWWYEVGDYLENPHRHFKVMEDLRKPMVWPESIVQQQQ